MTQYTRIKPAFLYRRPCPAADCSFVLNLNIKSNLVIRVCYQDNSIAPAASVPKPGRNSGSNRKNIPNENKINMGPERMTSSTVDDLLVYRDLSPIPSTLAECDEPVKWRALLYSHCGRMFTPVFLPLMFCEKAKAVNSQLR